MSDDNDSAETVGNGDEGEMNDALRAGLRQAGYHVMKAGYELLAGVSAFLEAVGGAGEDGEEDPAARPQRIEVE
ncbi:MAG: hypothetical protein GY720_20030 [bacterium]|nr:hypothetical protein [bacterium]